MQSSSQAEASKIVGGSSRILMSRGPSWGRQVWLNPVPYAIELKLWNLIKFNQYNIKQCVWTLYHLPNYSGLIKWRVMMGPLSLAHTFADGNLEGKKGRVWIVWELEVHLCAFLYAVLPFAKPCHPSLSLQPTLPASLMPELSAMVPTVARSWCSRTKKPHKLPRHIYMKSGNNM